MLYKIQIVVELVLLVFVLISGAVGFIQALKTFKKQDEENGWR